MGGGMFVHMHSYKTQNAKSVYESPSPGGDNFELRLYRTLVLTTPKSILSSRFDFWFNHLF